VSDTTRVLTGGCLCGAIRYEARGAPSEPSLCHCRSCQRASGAPAVGWASFRGADFEITKGEPKSFRSSEKVDRSFCPNCGTQLTYRHEGEHGWVDVTLASLDDPETLAPHDHIWTTDRLKWMEHVDGLPGFPRSRLEGR
jgi:hypothetical protein